MCRTSDSPRGRETLFAALEAEQGSAYVLNPDLCLEYVNEGWRRFARENGAPGLDCGSAARLPITHYFRPPLRVLFSAKFRRSLEHS